MSCEHTSAVLGTASQNNSICRAHAVRALGHEMQHDDALTLSSPRFVCRVTDYRDASAHIIHLFGAAGAQTMASRRVDGSGLQAVGSKEHSLRWGAEPGAAIATNSHASPPPSPYGRV